MSREVTEKLSLLWHLHPKPCLLMCIAVLTGDYHQIDAYAVSISVTYVVLCRLSVCELCIDHRHAHRAAARHS